MKKKIIFIISLLFGLMFINAGLNKFFNYMPIPDDMPEKVIKFGMAVAEIVWLMPLIGLIEVIGGILFMLPKTRALGAIIIFPVMVGILLTSIFIAPTGLVIALIILAINIWVIVENRKKYLPLIK